MCNNGVFTIFTLHFRRVHPTAFGSIRIPDEDMVVAGYQIPKDVRLQFAHSNMICKIHNSSDLILKSVKINIIRSL